MKNGTGGQEVEICRFRADYIFIALKICLFPKLYDGRKIVSSVTSALNSVRLNHYRASISKTDEGGKAPAIAEIQTKAVRSEAAAAATFCTRAEEYTAEVPA